MKCCYQSDYEPFASSGSQKRAEARTYLSRGVLGLWICIVLFGGEGGGVHRPTTAF